MAGKENEYPGMDADLKKEVDDRRRVEGVLFGTTENVEDDETLKKIKNQKFNNVVDYNFSLKLDEYIEKHKSQLDDKTLKVLKNLLEIYPKHPVNDNIRATDYNHPMYQFEAGKSKTRKNKSKKSKTKRSKKSKTKRTKK
jgi:hypothetical protein